MSTTPTEQVKRLKQSLSEMRENKANFSDEAFAQVIMLLLERLRRLQTIEHEAPRPVDEIRLVTVMFIDVKDSTEMVHQVGSSEWKSIIAQAHERIANIIALWDGQIGQYLGDGVLCFFGAQRSRGDDAAHAVSCALAIQQAVNSYAKEVQQKYKITFGVRIGISTGQVVVGMVGDSSKQELLALGLATNLASRLQGVAEPGEVHVDSATYGRIRRDFVTQAHTAIKLKGFDEPIKHYRVIGKRTQPATQFTDTHIYGIEMPLVGRDEDLALINYLCDHAINSNQFYAITIMGDVGIGKSRLLQETIHLTEGVLQPIVMSATYEVRTQVHNLLRDMLITQCNLTTEMPSDVIKAQVEAYISDLWEHEDAPKAAAAIGHLAGYAFDAPDGILFDWITQWFKGAAAKQPILIAVDNLQWADEQSVALLQHLAANLTDTPAILIAVARPGYRMIHTKYMQNHEQHRRITLDRLQSDATRTLVEAVLRHVQRVPDYLAKNIAERAEGNPLFVQEFLGMLFDNNVITAVDNGGWKYNIILQDTVLNSLPHGLMGILQARLDDLPTEARLIAQIAAVAGYTFWSGAVAKIADDPNTQMYINTLVLRGIIVERPFSEFDDQLEYSFRHTLYRDVAYSMLPGRQRETYHGLMADWLLQRIAGKHQFYPLLAEQFLNGGQPGAALYSYLEAVNARIETDHLADALGLIDKSLAIANKVPREEALPVVSKLWALRGQVLIDLGRYDEASAASQSALMLMKEIPDKQLIDTRIKAERILGLSYLSQAGYNDAYDALTRAHNLLPLKATAQISSVLRSFGVLNFYQGRLDESLAYQKRAYNHAKTAQDNRYLIDSLQQLGAIDIERGKIADALDCYEQTLLLSRQYGYLAHEALDLRYMGIVHLALLQPAAAYENFTNATELHQETGQHDVLLQAYRALALLQMGRTMEGKALLLDAVETGDRDVFIQQQLQLLYIQGLVVLDDFVKCREQALAFVEQAKTSNPLLLAKGRRWLGVSMYKLEDLHAAKTLHEALEAEQTYGGLDTWWCHYWIAKCSDNTIEQQLHFSHAAKVLRERLANLTHRPELHDSFKNHAIVQEIFNCAPSQSVE
jgi:class 3 adenylate cyclase/tetratricopeptide (TPR) repeat protein